MPYEAYDIDSLEPGYKMKIERKVYRMEKTPEELRPLIRLSAGELNRLRDESIAAEESLYNKLRKAAKEWETQAGQTILYNQALEYLHTALPEHTSNAWKEFDYGLHKRSNAVYCMQYRIDEYTRYDRETGLSVPEYYRVTWSVYLNTPLGRPTTSIAGQTDKRFDDGDKLDKYLAGRIKAYDKLFTEINPPIPFAYAGYFKVNGVLLPGYTIQET